MNRYRNIRGRGALSNPASRFDGQRADGVGDDWSEPDPLAVVTQLLVDKTRNIITHNDSPDVPFDRSINPYKGCEHGCIYCFARPTHAYLGLSPGLDFETRIVVKPDAAELLRKTFAKPSYRPQPIALGANTDPYQPSERSQRITRSLLEVMLEHRHPVGLITKSDLVLRDLDLLGPLAKQNLAQVYVSITSLDGELARRMEPRAAIPTRRLEALRGLAAAGVPCGVLASPMIPGLNDHELDAILAAAAAVGAQRAGTILVRLPYELRELFEEWLEAHYPQRRRKVLKLIRESRGGALNEARFGRRMRGDGPYAELLQSRFRAALKRYGLSREGYPFDCSLFRRPTVKGQLPLFS